MPDATRRWLAEYAAGGGKVLEAGRDAELQQRIANALPAGCLARSSAAGHRIRPSSSGDADVYFLANTSNVPQVVRARFGDRTAYAELWDPLTGVIEQPDVSGDALPLAFEPHGSRFIVFRKSAGSTRARASDARRSGARSCGAGGGAGRRRGAPRPDRPAALVGRLSVDEIHVGYGRLRTHR